MDTTPENEKSGAEPTGHVCKLKRWIGLSLVALSFVLYGGLLMVPMVPFSDKGKAVLSAMLVISGEGSFWIGAFILGKEAASRFRPINAWRWIERLLGRKP